LSLTRRVGVPNQNGVILRLPDGREVRITLWEWPRGDAPLGKDGEALVVRLRVDAPRDVGVVREELTRTDQGPPPSTPSSPGGD
jgi:hypothetical protein